MGMRIAFLAATDTGNGFYRGTAPMAALELRGHRIVRLPTDSDRVPLDAVRDVDLLLVHRFTDERAQKLVREAKDRGAAVVWDNDDDAGAIPKGTVAYRKFGGANWERRLVAMRRIFARTDLVTAPSPHLARRLADAGALRTAVIENYPPDQFLRTGRRSHAGVVVGWIAGREHGVDVEQLDLRAVAERLLDDRPELRVHTFGASLGIRSDRYVNTNVVPLLRLTEEATAFDIGIAPIADIGLNRARSNIKLKEYAAAGLPWLASPIGPYAGLGEKQGGRLVADDRWYDEVSRLLDKPRDRRKLQKHAAKWAAGETLEKNAHRWEELFLDTIERSRAARR
jgi:glycosyltransferase involved in cell wall biosynthesis